MGKNYLKLNVLVHCLYHCNAVLIILQHTWGTLLNYESPLKFADEYQFEIHYCICIVQKFSAQKVRKKKKNNVEHKLTDHLHKLVP